jgi:hypothetical protein
MDLVDAGSWGLAGGAAAALINVSAAVAAAGYRWPWRRYRDGVWPRVFVGTVGMLVGSVVAAAAHGQISGPWPALVMGASAPSVIRGILAGVEVSERKSPAGRDGNGAA